MTIPALPRGHLADQELKAVAACCLRARFAKVAIDHLDALARPAIGDRPLPQGVLALGALGVFHNLPE